MIGVETLHTVQIIFFAQSFAIKYYPTVRTFRWLDRSANFYSLILTSNNAVESYPYDHSGFAPDLFSSLASIFIFEGTAILIFFMVKMIIKLKRKFFPPSRKLLKSSNSKEE